MNKQQRKDWDELVNASNAGSLYITEYTRQTIIAANAYILKLERELQNIKQGKKIAAILMPHGGPR